MATRQLKFNSFKTLPVIIGFVLGAILVLGIRFVRYQPEEEVHYHANFGIYINGQRQKLDNPLLYEEVESCTENKTPTPSERAHLHDMVSDVVHVEDAAVTWGHFFQNIGYNVSDDFMSASGQMHEADTQNKVTFILNGEKVTDVTKRVIGNKDRLLVDYGNTPKQDLGREYNSIPTTAAKYNTTPDPASCGAGHQNSTMERLKHML